MKPAPRNLHFLTSILIMLTLLLAGCNGPQAGPVSPPTAAPSVKLVISGSGSTLAILKYLAEIFRQEHNNWAFEFLSGAGSSGGVKGALEGTLDLGAMARLAKDEELAQGIKYVDFATEWIAFVTSPDISVNALTGQQVKDIFTGKIINWSEVGGPDAPINVLARDEEESNTQILRKALFGETPFTPGAVIFTGEGDLRKALTSTKNAIAFVSYGGLRLEKVPANVITIDGFNPTDLSSNYPYTKPAGVVYIAANESKVQPFLDFITSEQARTLLAQQGISGPTD